MNFFKRFLYDKKTLDEQNEEWEKIHEEKMKALEEYASHFDGYGNVQCEHCETWIDTEFMGKQCPICNAKIPRYEFK